MFEIFVLEHVFNFLSSLAACGGLYLFYAFAALLVAFGHKQCCKSIFLFSCCTEGAVREHDSSLVFPVPKVVSYQYSYDKL